MASQLDVCATNEESETRSEVLVVTVRWGATTLAVRSIGAPGGAWLGDDAGAIAALPEGSGATRVWLARARRGAFAVEVPDGAHASVFDAAGERRVAGPASIATRRGDRVRLELFGLEVFVAHELATTAPPKPTLGDRLRASALGEVGLAGLLHALVAGAVAYTTPRMLTDDEGGDARTEQLLAMRQYLTASAEREIERAAEADRGDDSSPAPRAGEGSPGESGAAGTTAPVTTHGRWAFARRPDAPVALRRDAIAEASAFGAVALLGRVAAAMGGANAPVSPFGRNDAGGLDDRDALGALFGASIDDAAGTGGLALTGTGEGSDRPGTGIGLLDLGGLGRDLFGHDAGPGGGVGRCTGPRCRPGLRDHAPGGPSVRPSGNTEIGGSAIARELVQRIVRQSFGRFRACYETSLRGNPGLAGRVVTRFAIDRTGTVTQVADGGGDAPLGEVSACVRRAFYALSFPEHEGGIVTVVYPLVFQAD